MKQFVWVQVPLPAPRRSKVHFAPASFYACGKKDVIRPLPCSSFPTAARCAGLAVGGPPCGRHFSRLRNIDFNRPIHVRASVTSLALTFIHSEKSQVALVMLPFLFKIATTFLCCDFAFYIQRQKHVSRRSLASPFRTETRGFWSCFLSSAVLPYKIEPAVLGFNFAFSRQVRSSAVRTRVFIFRLKNTSRVVPLSA